MSEHQTNPKFDILLDKAGEFRFRLHTANGQIVLASEGYTTKQNCIHGIQSVKENSRLVDSFYADTAKDGSFYFGLKAGNGQIIGRSQMYHSKAGRDKGIISVMRNAKHAMIEDLTV